MAFSVRGASTKPCTANWQRPLPLKSFSLKLGADWQISSAPATTRLRQRIRAARNTVRQRKVESGERLTESICRDCRGQRRLGDAQRDQGAGKIHELLERSVE